MTEKIMLSEEDCNELIELYNTAQTTPVVLLFGKYDLVKEAWDAVRDKMNNLGEKYGYDSKTAVVNRETREVTV